LFDILESLGAQSIVFAYPIALQPENYERVCQLIEHSKKTIARTFLWGIFYGLPNDEELALFCEVWKRHKIGRMFRLRAEERVSPRDADALEFIRRAMRVLQIAKEDGGKLISIYPIGREATNFPKLIGTLKRWSTDKKTFNQNSLMEYYLYDHLKTTDKITQYLVDPYGATQNMPKNMKEYASELLYVAEEYPEILPVICIRMGGPFVG
jgi:hypothetical protein